MKIDKTYREAVSAIKEAILRSQHRAISMVNREQLSLYYGIGQFVSQNSRKGFWGNRRDRTDFDHVAERIAGITRFFGKQYEKYATIL
jgi:hypothetical protein